MKSGHFSGHYFSTFNSTEVLALPTRRLSYFEHDDENDSSRTNFRLSDFKPGWRFYVAFGSLSVVSLMAALDATSISVALPVCCSTSTYTKHVTD